MEKLKMAVQDCFIRSLPDLYGFILYAKQKDDFLTTIEMCQLKPLYSPRRGIDFNKDDFGWKDRYDFILSFNVIEKLMNPLHYLSVVKDSLRPDGKLILTTAIDWKFWGKDNFREFDNFAIVKIIHAAGLKVVNGRKLRVPWWRMNSWKWPLGQFWYVEASK